MEDQLVYKEKLLATKKKNDRIDKVVRLGGGGGSNVGF